MPCERIGNGFMCSNTVHKIGEYTVEFPKIGAPVALKPNGDIYSKVPGGINKFYEVVVEWLKDHPEMEPKY